MEFNVLDQYVSDYFRKRREDFKYSTRYVAGRLGLAKSTYYYYEMNYRSMPLDIVKKLLNLYNEDGNELIEGLTDTFNREMIRTYAYLHGYNKVKSIDKDNNVVDEDL